MAAPAEWFGDTNPETTKLYVELHRKMSEAERLTRVLELCEFQRGLVKSNVQEMYSGASEEEIRYQMAARIYGRDLARAAYGLDVDGGV
ncbi:MAG: hypothetical protein ABI972_03045 [Acidobacteriota bacterium]